MLASIAPLATSGERPEQLNAITVAEFAAVENFEHDFRVHDVSSTEVGQPDRERGIENSLFQPCRKFECMPEPHHRLLTPDACQ